VTKHCTFFSKFSALIKDGKITDALSKYENLQMDCEQCRPSVKFYCDPFLNAFSSKENAIHILISVQRRINKDETVR